MTIVYDPKKAHYITVTAILVLNGKFLIAKRSLSEKSFPGRWTVPGGKLETSDYMNKPKDTPDCWYNILESVVMREVKEETNLDIVPSSIGYVTSMVFSRPDGIPAIIVSLYANPVCDHIKLSDELTEYAWVTLTEAKNYDLIEGIYEELEILDYKLKGERRAWAGK
ncbi:MAG: NUDIX domain-containing protein [Nanoarchaeota archaeon]